MAKNDPKENQQSQPETKNSEAVHSAHPQFARGELPVLAENQNLTPEEGQRFIREQQQAALEAVQAVSFATTTPTSPAPAAAQANSSDVTDELEKGGPAFGSFVKSVGLAVAEAQTQLDKNLVETAKALSATEIDVIAVYEQIVSDDGAMEQGNPIKQKLPLVNYLMPTAYQWSRVYLEADMNVSEFNSASGFNIKRSSTDFNVNARANYSMFGGFGAGGSTNTTYTNSNTSVNNSYSQDVAAGRMHMEATLEPRHDIQLPQPFVVQRGPRLVVTAGSMVELKTDTADPAKVTGHQLTLTVTLTSGKSATLGNPLSGKHLSVSVDQPLVTYTMSADGATGADGKMTIVLTRQGAAYDATKPLPTVVKVWMGLVSQTIAVTL